MKHLLSIGIVLMYTFLIGQETYSKTYTMEPNYLQGSALAYNSDKIVVSVKTGCFDSVLYNCSYLYSFDYDGNQLEDLFMDDFGFGISQNLIFEDNLFMVSGRSRLKDTCVLKLYNTDVQFLNQYTYPKFDQHLQMVNVGVESTSTKILLSNLAQYSDDLSVKDQLYIINKPSMNLDTILAFPFSNNYDNIIDVQEDADGFITFLNRSLSQDAPWEELFIIRLDDVTYEFDTIRLTSTFFENYYSNFLILPNGNYVYTQFIDLRTNVIYCVDREGNPIWNFKIEGDGFEREVIQEMTLLENGDVLACGFYTGRYPEDPLVTEYDYEVNCGWLLRLSPDGDLIWRHYYPEFYKDDPWPTSRYSYLYDVEEMADGSIIATGMMSDYDEDGNRYKDDLWLLRVTADGCLEPNDCEEEMQEIKVVSSIEETREEKVSHLVYPNPASTLIEIDQKLIEYEEVLFYNISGSLIKKLNVTKTIDITNFEQGLYFLKFVDNSSKEVNTSLFITR